MTEYSRITNFTIKDSLATGEPEKLVSGQELQAEFDAIASAITSKANTADLPSAGATTTDVVVSDFTSDTATPYVTATVPAGSIPVKGLMEIDSYFTYNIAAGVVGANPVLLVNFGGAVFRFTIDVSTLSINGATGYIHFHYKCQNLNSLTAQLCSCTCEWGFSEASGSGAKGILGGHNTGASNGPFAINTAIDRDFVISDSAGAPPHTLTHRSTLVRVISP